MKKYIKYAIILAIIVGLCFTNWDLFKLIDIVIVCPITNILFIIYDLVKDFGLAIILFTVLVKLCMYPLSKSQLYQTRLMKKIQPELAEIRKRCNGNKQLESLQTMDLYKKYNVRPFRSILTLFIQLPIFIALYTAIRVIALPNLNDNLANRAYSFVQYEGSPVSEVISLQNPYLDDLRNDDIPASEKTKYDFEPKLFSVISLDGYASNVLKGDFSGAALFALFCALAASAVQYFVTRQQQPTNKGKSFKDLVKEAKEGKEIDQSEINALSTSQMSWMMPLMMLFIMINLPGALVFYYFLTNLISFLMNRFIFSRANKKMDDMTDKTILRELKKVKEAQIIENKKTGTKIKIKKSSSNKKGV